jgi:hypothetical protein
MTKHTSKGAAAVITVVALLLPGWRLNAAEPPIRTGDKIVVLEDTHLQAEREKLAPVRAGTELTAGEVQEDWVAVSVVRDGKTITGWIFDRQLLVDPRQAFTKLVCGRDVPAGRPAQELGRLDQDGDGLVTADEFAAKTGGQTLDDLNKRLARVLGSGLGTGDEAAVKHSGLMAEIADFKGWNRQFNSFEQASRLADDFVRTRDLRRSRLAQELVDRENLGAKVTRAQALFRWADKNHDGTLTLDEFKQALSTTSSPAAQHKE